jgi:hypothetical protein
MPKIYQSDIKISVLPKQENIFKGKSDIKERL